MQIENLMRHSVTKQPDLEAGELSRARAIERVSFHLNNLKQMAERD